MPHSSTLPTKINLTERQSHILNAASRVFARSGFHMATMNDIATEAAMSPGNLYRYFASKNDLVAGLIERDLNDIASNFAELDASNGDLLGQLEALGRRHLVHEPREKAIINLEIWLESSRNPEIARMCADVGSALMQGLVNAVEVGKSSGELPADLDDIGFLDAVFMMGDGLMCRRAVDPDYDAEAGADSMFAVMRALAQSLRK